MSLLDFNIFSGKRVFIETYGCRYNAGSTLKLVEILKKKGCNVVDTVEESEIVIVNTCTVVASTERRMLRRLSVLGDRNLYVTGCMAEIQRDAIRGVCSPGFIPDALIQEKYHKVNTVARIPVAIIQIASGCLGKCSYCITRRARGTLKSVPLTGILNEVRAYANAGAVEIQLTAQDASAWGRDLGLTLPDLLHALAELDGDFKIRVGMMNPSTVFGILEDLVEAFNAKNLFRFIHIPVQSGSDCVLQRMQRGYCANDFKEILHAFRRRFPEVSVATDIIVGYPGEEDQNFEKSLSLIRNGHFHKVNVTRYSRRPYTAAYSLPDTPETIKKERSRSLQACAEAMSESIHARYVGRTVPFLVTEQVRKGSVMARTPSYVGIVIPEDLPAGYCGRAEIRQARAYYLKGKRI